jgi:hypothetical protein
MKDSSVQKVSFLAVQDKVLTLERKILATESR